MLNRQRILLYMIHKAGGMVSRIQLMKWAFLLNKETASHGGSAFYGFIPYKYGPYSFLLRQDIRNLVKNNLIYEPDEKTWGIIPLNKIAFEPPSEFEDLAGILLRYRHTPLKDLMDGVHSTYPWYTINCELKSARLRERPTAQYAVYTIGYQGFSIDTFLNKVMESGIEVLADVRNSPWSRSFGFHRSTLRQLCEDLSIEYLGFPELGIPSSDRADLNSKEDRDILFKKYSERVLRYETEALSLITNEISKNRRLCSVWNPTPPFVIDHGWRN